MRSKALLVTSVALCVSNVPANAISWNTQMNCASDYYAYCSMHTAGSAGCHACMRTNRSKLSSSCVSALIDDGVLPKTSAGAQKSRLAVGKAKAKAPSRMTALPKANAVAKATSEKAAPATPTPEAVTPTPEAASPVANAEVSAPSEPPAAAAEPAAPAPPPQVADEAPAIDQQTFEALKNRAPYFLPTEDIASMFAQADENAAPQPSSPPR